MRREVAEMVENVVQIITGFDAGIAPVVLKIGYANYKGCCHEGLVIEEAPAIVVEHIVKQGYHCSMRDGGLHINTYKTYE